MFISIPVLILLVVIVCAVIWGKYSTKGDLDSRLMGTLTLAQAYNIASSYGNSVVKLIEAQNKAMHDSNAELFNDLGKSTLHQRSYLAYSQSQISAALMLVIARGVLNAKGDLTQFKMQREYTTVMPNLELTFPFKAELRPNVPDEFFDLCFSAYSSAFSSCTADDFSQGISAKRDEATHRYWQKVYGTVPLAYTSRSEQYHTLSLENS